MTFKAFLGYAKSVGTAIGAWLWLIKILAGVLGLALLFVSVNGWRTATGELAAVTERATKLKDEVVAVNATVGQLAAEKREILAESGLLSARYAELEKKVGRLTVRGTADVSTPVGGATAHGAAREKPPVVAEVPASGNQLDASRVALLYAGDKGHIRMLALSLETEAKNTVLLMEGRCYRDVPGPVGTEILKDTARVDLSEVLRLPEPKDPGVGVGPMIGLSGGRLVYGAMVSPATLNFKLIWNFQTELLIGGAANASGDYSLTAAALARLR